MAPAFKQAASTLKEWAIGFAAIDATLEVNKDIKDKYQISGFPKIKINNTT